MYFVYYLQPPTISLLSGRLIVDCAIDEKQQKRIQIQDEQGCKSD